MKKIIVFVVMVGMLLTACDSKIKIETRVNDDGSLERTITLMEADSGSVNNNMFQIHPEDGWEVSTAPHVDENGKTSKSKIDISFKRKFSGSEESNQAMDQPMDTMFRIHSAMEKKFRWFYTYTEYKDTYKSINRFGAPDQADYFTDEDYNFIERLPAEGKSISKPDSLYLEALNRKIFDQFVARAFYENHYDRLLTLMKNHNVSEDWFVMLSKRKDEIFSSLMADKVLDEDIFMLQIADSLGIPLPYGEVKEEYIALGTSFEKLITFMNAASEARITHSITLPGNIYETNADSVAGNTAFWKPSPLKYSLGDFTLVAVSRKMNYWTMVVSGVIILGFLFLMFRKRTAP